MVSKVEDDYSINQIHKDIKKEYKSLKNRIQSILLDARFLEDTVIPFFPEFPVIPNERCGLWYCNPKLFEQTSYFKSTDGHINQWDFSTRRLNFHLLPTLAQNGGIVIVDSTRRGKKIPDALSKTVPIWCAVLNSLMLESVDQLNDDYSKVLFVPPSTVPNSEYQRILKKLPLLIERLNKLAIIDGSDLYKQFNGKLLRPIWIHPGSSLLQSTTDIFTGESTNDVWETPEDEEIIPIILCTVSYRAQDGVDKRHGFTYVQGAADDHELWSHGLNPDMFWDNIEQFNDLDRSEDLLQSTVEDLLAAKQKEVSETETLEAFNPLDMITTDIFLGKIADGLIIGDSLTSELLSKFSMVIVFSESCKLSVSKNEEKITQRIVINQLQSGSKKSSKALRKTLPELHSRIEPFFSTDKAKSELPILICCNSGTDMSIALVLMLLCKHYDLDWNTSKPNEVNKIIIRKHLTKLISHLKGRNVNPSRATLNSVNEYLMSN
ncbi:hypothetical protein Kpol_1068p2 [Vanderwaltozyma polyspora DSM 70294]|uniref:Initiator tRNA phosphoribosyl transferase n=1 Tax=Vanderwaltozyma polyspora (strain ATCC 22028 / DSM 70294 / BCRC 21397 / CBS 2163 / NBRC 10782 / NRRL Y-8283 / UCD 57-17) TaxID=436907 RepID=A7TSQ7_VANPO|nr:uncharacterized protein Kpol_1068p2 [Vanderwaltozyma polyspora DSM 70294]EDO14692.1 hypothetical protein Kpol_1068p2 [Vanderwaltozyma polyspora DSM 70294]